MLIRDCAPRLPARLSFPAGAGVLVAGLPGAGKSTLVARTAGPGHASLDTDPPRARWRRRLPGVPYPLWRPVLHATHLAAAWRGLARPEAIVFTDTGTRRWVRALLVRRAARLGRELHLLAIDATPAQARSGQQARGQTLSARALRRHARRWSLVRTRVPVEGFASVTFISRAQAARLRGVSFASPKPRHGRAHAGAGAAPASQATAAGSGAVTSARARART